MTATRVRLLPEVFLLVAGDAEHGLQAVPAAVGDGAADALDASHAVDRQRQPGRDCTAAKYALCRAVHRRVRSSGVTAHSKALPPSSLAISCTVCACSCTLEGEP